jgi:peptidoglycan/LPS O-acetylase OafA/YrhL
MVIVCHLLLFARPSPEMRRVIVTLGWNGVSIFFVISGYLITMLLLREESKYGRISLRLFYCRRFLRIFPAFYFYLVVLLGLSLLGVVAVNPHSFLASFLYLRNISGSGWETDHLWSLSLEEQFYFMWPFLLVVLATAWRRVRVVTGLLIAICLWRSLLIITGHVDAGALQARTDLRIDTILVGCLLALLVERGYLRTRLFPNGWVALVLISLFTVWGTFAIYIPFVMTVYSSVTAILVALILNWFITRGFGPLERKPIVFVGKLSYSLYLWQQLFIGPHTAQFGVLRRFPLNVGLVCLAACASYFVIERRFLAVKDRYFSSSKRDPLSWQQQMPLSLKTPPSLYKL